MWDSGGEFSKILVMWDPGGEHSPVPQYQGDTNPLKGPRGDPGLLKGTNCVTVAQRDPL